MLPGSVGRLAGGLWVFQMAYDSGVLRQRGLLTYLSSLVYSDRAGTVDAAALCSSCEMDW